MAVEFRSGLEDAWYDVLMAKDGCDRLRVKFVGFGDDHDEAYEVSELSSFIDIDEFRRRFRQVSVQVQDTECVSAPASTNTPPFSQHHHHQCLKEMGREGSDEVHFFRVPGGVQEPPAPFRLRGRLAAEKGVVSFVRRGTAPALRHRHTADTSYCKAKYAAERFQLLLFAACPFTLRASKLTAHPYNFVLFPRDVLKMRMPTYSFSIQTSHLTSMAEEGFDFNACIYNGADRRWVKVGHMDAGKLAGESTQIVSRILVKALMAMLSPDFSLCLCLIPERVMSMNFANFVIQL